LKGGSKVKKYLSELCIRKDLIKHIVTSGLKAEHRNSYLGYLWWLLDPLLSVAIYYFVVVAVFNSGGQDYGAYLVIGMVVWRWLNSTVSTAARSIISQSGIITQVYMPKVIFPIGATLTQLINFGFGFIVIIIFLIFFKIVPGFNIIWLPVIVLIQFLFSTALAFFVAYICSFVRDVDNFLNHLMRLWFYGSPVIWKIDMLPANIHWILQINPMVHLLNGYREILLFNSQPNLLAFLIIGSISLFLIALMIHFYNQNEHKIIKIL
jgi:lipopolysaccharide transport system permease protein